MTTIYWAPENYCQITEVWLQHGVVFLISIKEAGELNKKVAWKIPVGVSATESFCFKDSYLLTHKSCYWVVLTQFGNLVDFQYNWEKCFLSWFTAW